MKSKTIKKIFRQKVNAWLKTIQDEDLRKEINDNCIITGGAIASMLLGEPVNDYDIYLTNKETTKKVAEYYVKKFKENPPSRFQNMDKEVDIVVLEEDERIKIKIQSQGIASEEGTDEYQYFEMTDPNDPASDIFIEHATNVLNNKFDGKGKYKPVFLTSNAITLSDDVQIVIRFYGEPDEIHKNYDFVHCTNYWISKTNELVLRSEALESLLTKELVYIGSRYPLASVIRTRKFIQRGFTCNAGQYLKMAMQISDLDLYDVKVLEEQLIGVDVAYFMELISTIKANEKDKKLDYTYIVEVIDKIF